VKYLVICLAFGAIGGLSYTGLSSYCHSEPTLCSWPYEAAFKCDCGGVRSYFGKMRKYGNAWICADCGAINQEFYQISVKIWKRDLLLTFRDDWGYQERGKSDVKWFKYDKFPLRKKE